ncbi:MAG: Single-stranded DNA-binding protein-like protein [Sphaerisporangium sp.]|nr:Single-stranded DNA-binding protein-like protein [Sphaerisporangium sp.]
MESDGPGKLAPMSAETVRRPAMGGTMNDIYVTLSGNVSTDPREYHFDDGSRATSLRLATTRRVFDKASQSWHDGETTFYTVRCYRVLADNVAQSVKLGQPIVVHGKLRIRSYERDGERRFLAEVEATSLGHDLRRGVSSFEKSHRGVPTPSFDEVARQQLALSTRDWELGGPTAESGGSPGVDPRFALTRPAEAGDTHPALISSAEADLAHGGVSDGSAGGDLTHGGPGDPEVSPGSARSGVSRRRSGRPNPTHIGSAETGLVLAGAGGDGDSGLARAESRMDTVEGSDDVGSWPGGETVERLAA